ncbi:cytochrome C biogenesis protein [Fusibacter sp. JL298sf-3]
MTVNRCKLEVYIPESHVDALREALNDAGLLKVGCYDMVCSTTPVKGFWRPLEGANPYDGTVGTLCSGEEVVFVFRCAVSELTTATTVIRSVHPYEVPVYDVTPILERV